ncbi:hypothetical protein GKQ38_00865 [Candidatus Nanohaloarchaea archaeon]|nr:hypothetical protein GKQ38_00865 [Candidatus Nanohaloarchaea archaeon]
MEYPSLWREHVSRLNILLDKGEELDLDKTIEAIENYRVTALLEEEFEEEIDLTTIKQGNMDSYHEWLMQRWGGLASKRNLKRKTGVENNGICMLIGLSMDILTSYDHYKEEFGT